MNGNENENKKIYNKTDNTDINNSYHDEGTLSIRGMKATANEMPLMKKFMIALPNLINLSNNINTFTSNNKDNNTFSNNQDNSRNTTKISDNTTNHYNPTGYIILCIAENKLVTDMFIEHINQTGTLACAFNECSGYHYNSMLGLSKCRDAISYFLYKYFYKNGYDNDNCISNPLENYNKDSEMDVFIDHNTSIENALQYINPNNICISCGSSPILNNIFCLLGNDNDCCLIPAPYYTAFENDMNIIAGIKPYPMDNISNVTTGPSIDELNFCFDQALSNNYKPKFILITNPNNPLGTIYSKQTIINIVNWARSKKLHIIVDEVYALSTHKVRREHCNETIYFFIWS